MILILVKINSKVHDPLDLFYFFVSLHRWLVDSMTVRFFRSFLSLVLRICLIFF